MGQIPTEIRFKSISNYFSQFLLVFLLSTYFTPLNAKISEAEQAMLELLYGGEDLDRQLVMAKATTRALKSGGNEAEYAEQAVKIHLIQKYLNSLGIDTGSPDGVFGSKTRKGISAFASKNELKDGMVSFEVYMRVQSLKLQVKLDEDKLPSEIERSIRYQFKDPDSVIFSSMTSRKIENGSIIYCGQANGKNSYGAYSGPSNFYISNVGLGYPHIDAGGKPNVAEILCMMLR